MKIMVQRYFTYILKCSDNSLYVGWTQNIQERLQKHNAGQGPIWTRSRLPVKLVYYESFDARSKAIHREQQIKKWSLAKKKALIDGDSGKLKSLSKRRR